MPLSYNTFMILKRISYTQAGTFGVLIDATGIPFAVTLELPWENNEKYISCIPSGYYKVKRIRTKDTAVFKIQDVINRTGIDMHVANLKEDLKGCVGIGEEFGYLHKKPGILSSEKGFQELIRRTHGIDEFKILIDGDLRKEPTA